jgi:undecaprenyl-diphosphatase
VNPLLLVAHSDDWVGGRIRRWTSPRWLHVWMVVATRLGDGWAWVAVVLTVPLRHDPARGLAEGLFAVTVVNVVLVGLKRCCRRERPALRGWEPDISAPDRFSFPSGHTMNAFAVAVLVSARVPAAAPVALVVASSIGASRIALGLHYPSDVAAGALLGGALAAMAVLALG